MKRSEAYFKAIEKRDRRFDGKFFFGVRTTGIYCRPICPARPKRKNIELFKTAIEAENAGYRACLRCRPEVKPSSPAWNGTSAVVQRAVKLLRRSDLAEINEDRFAMRFGVTARHLRRLFKAELGLTPKQIFIETRLALSHRLISETKLPISEIALASGFKSVRRFNDAFKKRYKTTPNQIRDLWIIARSQNE